MDHKHLDVTGSPSHQECNLDDERLSVQQTDLEVFLKVLQECGSENVGNVTLRNKLDWDEDRYWDIQKIAFEGGSIRLGRGKGGSVSIVKTGPTTDDGSPNVTGAEQKIRREKDLYAPILEELTKSWIKSKFYEDAVAQQTAHQGRTYTGGTWSRPDLSVVAVKAYEYVPTSVF